MDVAENGDRGRDGPPGVGTGRTTAYDSRVTGGISRSERRLGLALASAGVALALGVVALLRWRLWSAGVPTLSDGDLTGLVEPAALAADRDYRRGLELMAWIGAPLAPALAMAVALAHRRWAGRLLLLARGRAVPAAAALGAGVAAVIALGMLPLGLARYAWVREHGVGRQPLGSWLLDRLEGGLIQMVVFAAAAAVLALAIRLLPRAWWVALGGLVAVLAVGLTLLTPVLIAPRFESTGPLQNAGIAADVRQLADRAGVEIDEVVVSDASTRTRALNARVEGLGATRRVVLDDTLIDAAPREEARWVVAHELAHAARAHVVKGVAWVAALALPLALIVFGITGVLSGFGAVAGEALLARAALVLASVVVLGAVTAPLSNAVSRAYEAEADWVALQLTDEPQAAIDYRIRARALSRGELDPPFLTQLWFGSHPTSAQRIGLAQRYAAEHGGT